ncbi:MAG TPA: ATP-binding protein [Bryobacteraceae bacterium]|nr:ATP-binding protein [Bryobacteraceae bacterium]
MRSLFAKILIWFWATLVITTIGSALITMRDQDRPALLDRLVEFELRAARAAYEQGGRQGLAAYLAQVHAAYRGRMIVTDRQGRDLVTGRTRADLVARAEERERFVMFRRGGMVVVRTADDGQYRLFLLIPRRPRVGTWFLFPEHWWVMAIGVLLCWVLAYHLTRPVRQMQKAVERFGHGELSARSNSKRGDELGQLARTFDRMADRIQTLLAAERRLLGDVSHELRSPLARLGVAVELARSGENRQAALDRIQKEADRLNELVGQLLQVTRAEGDPSALRSGRVRLDLLLGDLAADGEIEARARGCEIVFAPAPACTVVGDPELLRRTVENVIRNAIRYAPAGTSVEVTLECGDPMAVVRVRDCGPGVPAEALPRIFDPFYRVEGDRDRASGGAGLGLAIARRAVELHGGSITARNAGPGLLVEIALPKA